MFNDLIIKICDILMIEVEEIKDLKYNNIYYLPYNFTVILNSGKKYDIVIKENKNL